MVNDVNKFIMPNGDEIKIDGLYGKITNCLLEVPQRIKLELNDGTLTLKAGSQVIVPNGFKADGTTPKFDYVTIESDMTTIGWSKLSGMVFAKSNKRLDFTSNAQITSGNSATLSGGNVWYDTATNTVKRCNDSSTWTSGYSFPICLATSDGSNATSESPFSSIDQTFNGMGYIGSTVWVDKGVKGLAPNGRNEDGTLRNIEFTTDNITTVSVSDPIKYFGIKIENNKIKAGVYGKNLYDEETNAVIYNNVARKWMYTGTLTCSSGNITSFQPKQPFRAVDTSSLTECQVVIDTYVNGTSGYRIWSDGYCEQWGGYGTAYTSYTTKTITFLKKFKDTNYCLVHSSSANGSIYEGATYTKTTKNFSVVNSINYNSLASWKAGGYLAEGEY